MIFKQNAISGLKQDFEYDELNRLTQIYSESNSDKKLECEVQYDNAGNIIYKTGVGNISYQDGTNRISSISNGKYDLPIWDAIEYTSFNKIKKVKQDHSTIGDVSYTTLNLTYGSDKERKLQEIDDFRRMKFYNPKFPSGNKILSRKYYVGKYYEKIIKNNNVQEINYIFADGKAVAICEKDNDSVMTFYVHHDNIGSIVAYTDEKGGLVSSYSEDAWGRKIDAKTGEYVDKIEDEPISDRGFTGHEHIDMFDMINMDGRMYDPYLGRFLSPDPFIQAPDNTQSLNRYVYCINNPLSLVDPSGYNWMGDTFSAIIGIAVGLETGGLGAGVWGAVIGGACGGASSALASCLMNGANLWQTAKSTFIGGFWGAASGAANFGIGELTDNFFASVALHTVSDGSMEALQGGHLEHGLLVGLASSAGGQSLMEYGGKLTDVEQIAANATLGGTVSMIGGGKFASGAMTAAFQMMYNDQKHLKRYQESRSRRAIRETILSDGMLTLDETFLWYKIGNGEPLTVDASKINLNYIDVDELTLKQNFQTSTWMGGLAQGLVYGSVSCTYLGNSNIRINHDNYDFDPHLNPTSISEKFRNWETFIANKIHGEGKSFQINFKGVNHVSKGNRMQNLIM